VTAPLEYLTAQLSRSFQPLLCLHCLVFYPNNFSASLQVTYAILHQLFLQTAKYSGMFLSTYYSINYSGIIDRSLVMGSAFLQSVPIPAAWKCFISVLFETVKNQNLKIYLYVAFQLFSSTPLCHSKYDKICQEQTHYHPFSMLLTPMNKASTEALQQ